MYLIDVPPATVSGKLHMGHLFSYSHMDFIARFQKMKGQPTVYPFCFDNNGLPTEKLAEEKGITDHFEVLKHSCLVSEDYKSLFRKMAIDFDYTNYYHTHTILASNLAVKSFRDLQNKGLVYKTERDVFWCPVSKTAVSQSEIDDEARYERSGAKVERRRMDCWYVSILNRLNEIKDAVNKIEWHPEHFKHRLLNWLNDYKYDWCISRQRRYGVQIPNEKDVFDTWFISSLTPQMAWMTKTKKIALKCPIFDARFQGHDIIYTWALYTIVKSLYHNDQIPWRHIVVSGHVLTGEGHKMSKSKGKMVPPLELLTAYGPDAIRYWAAHTQPGNDSKIDLAVMQKGKKLLNKLKNAKRFLDMNPNEGENDEYRREWLNAREYMNLQLELHFNWSHTLGHLTAFFWNSFCDKYIEESKKVNANRTLQAIFDEMLDYFEIFLPNVREACEIKT